MKITVIYPGVIKIYKDILKISAPEITIEKSASGEPWKFTALGVVVVSISIIVYQISDIFGKIIIITKLCK